MIVYLIDCFTQHTLLISFINKGGLMKISTKGDYGTRALLDLAINWGNGPILLRDVAQRQQIPLLYLQRLISPLVAGGIVRSTRGARGGVWLARRPEDIRLNEVIQLLEGSIAPLECVDNPRTCNQSESCAARDIWGEAKEAMNGVLESTTLQDLVERQKAKGRPADAMYYI
jgi:Rrf2 family cysteine metabolism transcriptional repressor